MVVVVAKQPAPPSVRAPAIVVAASWEQIESVDAAAAEEPSQTRPAVVLVELHQREVAAAAVAAAVASTPPVVFEAVAVELSMVEYLLTKSKCFRTTSSC